MYTLLIYVLTIDDNNVNIYNNRHRPSDSNWQRCQVRWIKSCRRIPGNGKRERELNKLHYYIIINNNNTVRTLFLMARKTITIRALRMT